MYVLVTKVEGEYGGSYYEDTREFDEFSDMIEWIIDNPNEEVYTAYVTVREIGLTEIYTAKQAVFAAQRDAKAAALAKLTVEERKILGV